MISYHEYLNFCLDFHSGAYPHQRFGQAFMNKFSCANDPILFYTGDITQCQKIIIGKYIDWSK